MTNETKDPAICCPEFDPAPWQDKQFTWENKKFIRDRIFTLYYMPIGFGKMMKRLDGKIRAAGADTPGYLGLSDHTSPWNMDMYVAVDKEIPDAENVILSGNYFSRVYEGPFRDTGKWMKDFNTCVTSKGLKTEKVYMWYTTCPKCAKKYGKNYVVVLAHVE